jgi:hypothetical protein
MSLRPSHPQAPLTEEQRQFAASVQIARDQNVKNLDKAVLMIELRKWCVVQAVAASAAGAVMQSAVPTLARDILEFVSEPIE